jgi:eukaryotic-like serine/threonine-protein kinase
MLLAFGPFELDLAACELRCEGRTIAMQPRVFDTLRYLVERRDRVVSKQELIGALWSGQQLNSVAVPWSISHARKALGQRGRHPSYIETVRGRGYRFVADVRLIAAPRSTSAGAAPADGGIAPALRGGATLHERVETAFLAEPEPFVGRAEIMLQLEAALDVAGTGHGGLCLLTGDAGMGKTRCANELAALARHRGLSVWSGRCLDGGVAPGFWPFIQILRDAAPDASVAEPDRAVIEELLLALVPHAEAQRATEPGPPHDDGRFWLLDRLSRCLIRSARARVRVLVIDDLHWADESSLLALSLLTPLLAHSHMLVLAAARDSARSELERAASWSLARFAPCSRIALAGLQVGDVERYLQPVLGELLASELSSTLHARTAGNPLFLREGARQVFAQHRRDGSVRASDVKLPEAAKGFFDERLRALDALTRSVLDAACVIGDEIEIAMLQHVTGLPAEQILTALQAAMRERIVEPAAQGLRYGFLHPLVREVLYTALAADERARLHAQVGLAIEALALVEPKVHELAYHFHRAASPEHYPRVVRYGRAAGDAALRAFAYDEAVQLYGWALDAQPYAAPGDTEAACDLLLASAGALLLAGRRRESRAQCKRVVTLAQAAGLADPLIRAAWLLRPSIAIAQVPDATAVSALEQALALLPETAVAARAKAYSQLACIPPYATNMESLRATCDEALRLARSSGDPALLLDALMPRLRALSGPETSAEMLQLADEILRLEPRQVSGRCADVHVARYHALLRTGDTAAAERALESFGRIAHRLHAREWIWHYDRILAVRLMQAGNLDAAERRFNELWASSQRLKLPYGPTYYGAQLNALSLERTGRRLPAGLRSTAAPPGRDASSWASTLPAWRAESVLFAIDSGDSARARRELQALAEGQFAAVTRDGACLFAFAKLAKAAVALADRDVARELETVLLPWADQIAVGDLSFSAGCVSHYLGTLARLREDAEQARAHFERAIAIGERTGDQLQRPRSQLALALLLADTRSPRERAQARELAAEVASAAERMGLQAQLDAALQLSQWLADDTVASSGLHFRPAGKRKHVR